MDCMCVWPPHGMEYWQDVEGDVNLHEDPKFQLNGRRNDSHLFAYFQEFLWLERRTWRIENVALQLFHERTNKRRTQLSYESKG